jgi:oxygen-dependent protoporphyrinogen oxidase
MYQDKLDIAVIGAGVAGLAAALRIHEENKRRDSPIKFRVFDESLKTGGTIETVKRDGFLIDRGPDSFISENKETYGFIKSIGLHDELIGTSEKNRRSFIIFKKKLCPVPEGFYLIAPVKMLPILASPLITIPGKLRMAMELFMPRRSDTGDESVASFVSRRFGKELFEKMAQPMVSGVYSGDPEALSAQTILQRFHVLEEKYGSVIRGLQERTKKRRDPLEASGPRYSLFLSFRNGMSSLTERMTGLLPEDTVQRGVSVTEIFLTSQGEWTIVLEDGKTMKAAQVLIATPAYRAAILLKNIAPGLSEDLSTIQYESVATIQLGYKRNSIGHKLNGFGFVAPKFENLPMIGCSFSSVKFAGRAPSDSSLLRVFVGGAFGRRFLELDDKKLVDCVKKDLNKLLMIKGEPVLTDVARFSKSMPQYRVNHKKLIDYIQQKSNDIQGLYLTGSAYRGVGISSCISDSILTADGMIKNYDAVFINKDRLSVSGSLRNR